MQGGPEYRPTDTSIAVLGQIERDLAAAKAAYAALMRDDLAAFNKLMSGTVTTIIDE